MVRKLFLATGVVLALSSAAWAQTTAPVPGGMGGPIGIGPDTSPRVPGVANPSDPRRALSGSRESDASRLGTTGGVDAGSALGGAPDAITGSGNPLGAGSIGSGSGMTGSGAITGGPNTPLPGASGMSGSGSLGGAAGARGGVGTGTGVGGGAGAAGSAGAGAGGGAR